MKIVEVASLEIPEVKIIRFSRFQDHRGFFSEHFRKTDLQYHPATVFLKGIEFLQCNESFSRAGTVRGLHFQWNPKMGKLVRTVQGHMIDLALDIRKGSPTFGKVVAHDMPSHLGDERSEWIWVPPGFAHGNFFPEDTLIEYFCTGEYNPQGEAGISPLAADLDWTLCKPQLREEFLHVVPRTSLISGKDKNAFSLSAWKDNPASENFIYEKGF